MAAPTASTLTIANAIKSLLDGSNFFSQTYLDEPPSFEGQSPVAVVLPTHLRPHRFTAGAGRNKDTWTWSIAVYIDRRQQTFDVSVQQLYTAIDMLRTMFQQHVELGSTASNILVSMLDGQPVQFSYRIIEGTLYRTLDLRLHVVETYNTPITS